MKCKADSCGRNEYEFGYCHSHYRRLKEGNLDKPIRIMKYADDQMCFAKKCNLPAKLNGLCQRHYRINIKHGDPDYPVRGRRDKYMVSGGYIMIGSAHPGNKKGERIYEHRYVMEQVIGRELLPGENVHHRNGDRSDNRPENLELWSTGQPYGQRVKDKLKWARELIELYEDIEGIV